MSKEDREFLFNSEWRGQKLPGRFGELLAGYDNQFKLVRQAARSTAPCDWGIDMSPGPETLLPQLARNKGISQTAKLRAMWALQQGRPEIARDDLLAAFALARNTSRDGTLISALVQIAIENIICSVIAENFYQFPPETLQELVDGFASAPARGTMAECARMEKIFFYDWLLGKIVELQKENPGDDAKTLSAIRLLVGSMEDNESGKPDQAAARWERLMKASGGTSDGILNLLREMAPLYDRLAVIMALPLAEYEAQSETVQRRNRE